MEVEVKQSEGFYLKAVVNDITDEGLDVAYEKGWRKPEMVKFEQCRVVLAESGQKPNFKIGDIVDAYFRIDKNDKDEMHGWNKMKIRDIKNDFAVVDSVEGPQMNDIIQISECRHPALPTSISPASVKTLKIELTSDLLDYFSSSDENYKVLNQTIPAILIKFNRAENLLIVKSFSASAIKKVEVLKDVFLSNARQKMMLLQRQDEHKKMLSVHEPQPDTPFLVEFDVSTAFMGLAIGAQGANISSARALDGITEIKLDESTRDQGFCKFKVYAQKAEAAEQARNMLEFLAQQKFVPQNKVGQVIGKQGKTIQDIVDKSGVVRVQIGDENPEQGMVPFSFTGTREAITHAELLVEFHLKHINEMDEIRAEEDKIRNKLFMSRNSPFQHYNGHQQQFQNQGSRQYQNNNNMRAQNGGNRQQDGERRMGGGSYRQGGPQQQQRGAGGGQFNRYNNQQGGGRAGAGGGARPFNTGGGGGGPRYGGGGGGQRRQYAGPQFRNDREQQKTAQRDQQPQRNANSPPAGQQPQPESEDETPDNGTFNSAAQGSDDSSEKTNTDKPQQPQNNSSVPPPPAAANRPQQRNMTGGFGAGRDRVPARNRRSKADDE